MITVIEIKCLAYWEFIMHFPSSLTLLNLAVENAISHCKKETEIVKFEELMWNCSLLA